MNLSIHLALTLNYLFYLWCGYSHIFFNVMSLPSLFCLYSKMSKLIQDQNIRRTLPTRPDKNLELSAKLFLYLYFIYICFVFYFSGSSTLPNQLATFNLQPSTFNLQPSTTRWRIEEYSLVIHPCLWCLGWIIWILL